MLFIFMEVSGQVRLVIENRYSFGNCVVLIQRLVFFFFFFFFNKKKGRQCYIENYQCRSKCQSEVSTCIHPVRFDSALDESSER